MQTPILPFLLVNTTNESILQKADQKLKFVRIQRMALSQPTTLKSYISQMRNYQTCTHFVIDMSVIKERGDDFTEALETIKMLRDDLSIIIYAVDLNNEEEMLDSLVRKGFTNIIAVTDNKLDDTEKWEQIQKDIADCFSEDGLPRSRWELYQKTDTQSISEIKEKIRKDKSETIPDFSKSNIKICVFGVGARVGTTASAMILASYFAAGNADVNVVLQSSSQLNALSKYCGKTVINSAFTYDNRIIFSANDAKLDENAAFNVTIVDLGKYGSTTLRKGTINIIVIDVGFDRISNSLQQLDTAFLVEDEPFKIIANLCNREQWNHLTEHNLIDKEIYNYEGNPPLLLPFIGDKLTFTESKENIVMFNDFFAEANNDDCAEP